MAEVDKIDQRLVVASREGNLDTPLRVLGPVTHSIFSAALDSHKILLSPNGLHRDWRGLAEYARLDVPSIGAASRISFTSHCLHLWGQAGGSVQQLHAALVAMDRHDVIDDTRRHIEKDIERIQQEGYPALPPTLQQQESIHSFADENILTVHDQQSIEKGGGLTHYDALVLHADEDLPFVQTLLQKMEGEYGLKLCVKDRDLVGGLQFESSSVVRLITERCSRVVVCFSKSFLASRQNEYFLHFAHALSIDQRRRIMIPCMLEPCERPAVINFCHSLDYFRAKGYWDYWKKLHDSIVRTPARSISAQSATITELPSNFPASALQGSARTLPSLPAPPAAAAAATRALESTKNIAASSPTGVEVPNCTDRQSPDSVKSARSERHQKSARLRSPGLFKWRKREKKTASKDEDRIRSMDDTSKLTSRDSSTLADVGCAETTSNSSTTNDQTDTTTSVNMATDVSYLSVSSVQMPARIRPPAAIGEHSPQNLSSLDTSRPTIENPPVNGALNPPSQHTASSLQLLLPDVESVTEEISPKSSKNSKPSRNPVSKFLKKAKKRVQVPS